MKKPIGIHRLYARNPIAADREIWGRLSDPLSRRGFLRGSGLAAMSAALGAAIPFAQFMPGGLIPAALAQTDQAFELAGKSGLVVLNDRPLNLETPAHLLDDSITPVDRLFVRNNGSLPQVAVEQADSWELELSGESCLRPKKLKLADLKSRFRHYSLQLQLECGGNGRSEFYPSTSGIQWTTGAIGCPEWTGVRLRDVLEDAGMREDAVYVAYEGSDIHLSGDPNKRPISRGVPIAKAIERESLIAWAVNGEALPSVHGFPLRLVIGGWPGSVSGKWVKRILIRDRVHDGEKMLGDSYRVPCGPVAPGADAPDGNMCIIESMPVRSLITRPKSGLTLPFGNKLTVRGHAWAGDLSVRRQLTSIDFGATWQRAQLDAPANRLAWQRWEQNLVFPKPGYYEVWARAEDSSGRSQPMVLPGWNPGGYLNNACHRIAVQVNA